MKQKGEGFFLTTFFHYSIKIRLKYLFGSHPNSLSYHLAETKAGGVLNGNGQIHLALVKYRPTSLHTATSHSVVLC